MPGRTSSEANERINLFALNVKMSAAHSHIFSSADPLEDRTPLLRYEQKKGLSRGLQGNP